jgi:predicted nucleotide-binding protein
MGLGHTSCTNLFLNREGEMIKSEKAEKTCFLIGPKGSEGSEVRRRSDSLLRYVIAPVVAEAGYTLLRADDMAVPGSITTQVLQLTIDAPLVIADLSGSNPNVLYELGIRHVTGKPVIQIASSSVEIPFDISAIRAIIVDSQDLDSLAHAKQQLLNAIREVEQHPNHQENPVISALELKSLQELHLLELPSTSFASPNLQMNMIATLVSDLDSRMKGLEYRIDRSLRPAGAKKDYSRRVFIIHGHDGELKNELARFLERLDFVPIILHEQPDQGRTIFTKLKGELSDVGFAFVLLTPDDVGGAATSKLQYRARQNVIFEHGLVVAALAPDRVCAIRRGEVEIPSDLHGVLYKTIGEGAGFRSIAIDVANELRAAGYILDANKLLML